MAASPTRTGHSGSPARPSSPDRLLDRLAPLLDDRCGVIAGLAPLEFPPGFENVMHGWSACVARPTELHPMPLALGRSLTSLVGYGTAMDESTAKVRAVCEAIERYCAVMVPTEGVVLASARELGRAALDPSRLPQCSKRERLRAPPAFRLRPPDRDRPEAWVLGFSVTRDRDVWVPLTAAYLALPLPLSDHLTFPISTGFAVGESFERAILSGLCEVIERDALALFWLHQRPAPPLAESLLDDPRIRDLSSANRALGVESHLLDLTTDVGVPVVGVVQTSARRAPHVIAMGACRTEPTEAALRVLEEAGSLRVALAIPHAPVTRDVFLGARPTEPEDFGRLYAGPDALDRFELFTRADRTSSSPQPLRGEGALHAIVARLADLGAEVIAVDVTLPEIAAFGLRAVKVIVPELMPISFSHHIRYLAHPRLYEAPARMGYGPLAHTPCRTEETITDDPIPFA